MGYRMSYGKDGGNIAFHRKNKNRKMFPLIAIIIFAVLLCCSIWRNQIVDFLLPGDARTTKKAIVVFVSELRSGESMTSALDAFCKAILNETNLY